MTFINISKATLGAMAVMGSIAFGTYVSADELVMSSWLPPQHPVVEGIMQPWADSVAEVTDGRVTVRLLPKPLGPPPAHYDLAADGVADITYGLHSFTKDDRFLRSRLGQFSFIGDTATDASVAYWNTYAGDLDAQAEHQGTKLLGLFVHGPGLFHNNQRKIETVEDFAGLKVRTPGGYIADLAEDLGIITQFMGPGQVFEKLSTGVIDGVTFPLEAIKAFNLGDHVTHSMRVPGGIYNTSWFLVMNEDIWGDVSEKDRAAIESISGEAFARLAGARWDLADAQGAEVVATTDIEVYNASPEVLGAIQELAAAHEAEWAEAVKAIGFDGEAALAAMRAASGL
jgi:TRAP-type C4-dicarboxylate transport system substrate-binding protein|tara:strand:- start:2037 stop:3062 length:1026 start_codon:yes stop_codon:yes gene_type:complete